MGFFDRFKQGLTRVFKGKTAIDASLLEDLEDFLLGADISVQTTEELLKDLQQAFANKGTIDSSRHPCGLSDDEAHSAKLQGGDPQAIDLKAFVKQRLYERLKDAEQPLILSQDHKPFFILVVGVNGSGKTTSIAKLAKWYQAQDQKVLLAAGDTFRAAAIEQLAHWAAKENVQLIAQHSGADSASVIFDAFQAAKTRHIDVLIADTAGRLHTQDHLMEELRKICRVARQLDPSAPHEILLVLDASLGQNALAQATKFHEALQLTGIVLSKLDGTAKGGIIFDIHQRLNIPIRFMGVGEKSEDLKVFKAQAFMDALFDDV